MEKSFEQLLTQGFRAELVKLILKDKQKRKEIARRRMILTDGAPHLMRPFTTS